MEKLVKIQRELKAPKNQYNNFGKYKYRSCEDILEGVKPMLDGATLILSDEMVNLGDRYYIKATATIKDGNESESATGYAREALSQKGMGDAQITGSASSYARKYALNGLFCIDDTKDDDTKKPENTKSVEYITASQVEELKSIVLGKDDKLILLKLKIGSFEKVPKSKFKKTVEFINKHF